MQFFKRSHLIIPLLVALGILVAGAIQLSHQGRIGYCACGQPAPWAGDIWSAHNSQHLFDPYSFTHLLHGVLFFWILTLILPKVPRPWPLIMAMAIETAWEILENSAFIIQRYREATIGLGYEGDSITNSIADILCCVTGFLVAQRLPFRWSLALFISVEVILLFWVRDNLTLNILMLTCPVESIKAWQMIH